MDFSFYGKCKDSNPGILYVSAVETPIIHESDIYTRRPSIAFSFRDLVIRFFSPYSLILQILRLRLASSLARGSFRDYESLLPAFRPRNSSATDSKIVSPVSSVATSFIHHSSMISGARNCTLLQYFTSCTILLPQLSRSTSLRVPSSSSSSSSCRSSRTMRLSKLQLPAPLPITDFFFFFSRILFWRMDRRGYLYLKVEQNGRALEFEYALIDRGFVALRIKFILSYFTF